jgi:predicted phosphodiesterase
MSRKNTWLVVGLIALVVTGGVVALFLVTAEKAPLLGPMVQLVTPTSGVVTWQAGRTAMTVRLHRPDGSVLAEKTVNPADGHYTATFDGLEPDSHYPYEIVRKNGAVVAKGQLPTAPIRGEPFRILAFGDSGRGGPQQYELARRMAETNPQVIVHVGDVVYDKGEAKDYPAKFYAPYAPLLNHVPFYPTLGNHDWDETKGGPYFANFVLPANGPEGTIPEQNYWFDFGDVRFVCIDSNQSFADLRAKVAPWADRVLADAGDRWKILFYHHAVYTSGKYAPAGKIRQLFVPLCDKYHVALALQGHNHMYERTYPIREDAVVEPGEGTIYLTTGAGGAELYQIREPVPDYLFIQENRKHSYTLIDVTPQQFAVQQVGIDGAIIDTFDIPRPKTEVTSVDEGTGTQKDSLQSAGYLAPATR